MWGDRLRWMTLPQGTDRIVRGPGRPFAEGGCLLDVDGDTNLDLVVNEGRPDADLVWYRAPHTGTVGRDT